ncbi:MAG: hypothetical protein N2489_06815 [Clostridia bacterium]|nr:hypothetical protein [Clostridia bacterium]
MNKSVVYERDLLFPTETLSQPGSIHVEILNPDKKGKMPVLIESRTEHSPLNYIGSILRIMQSDIFDRIHINLKVNTDVYIKVNDELSKKFGASKYVKVVFKDENTEYYGVDDIEI